MKLLKDKSNVLQTKRCTQLLWQRGDLFVIHHNGARGGLKKPCYHGEQCTFTTPTFADNGGELPVANAKADIVDGSEIAEGTVCIISGITGNTLVIKPE